MPNGTGNKVDLSRCQRSRLVRNTDSAVVKRVVAFAVLSLVSQLVAAQQAVTLRFVDYKTGKPIPNIRVTGILWNGTSLKSATKDQGVVSKVSTRTTKDGLVTIPLPASIPEHLTVSSLDAVDQLSIDLVVSQVLATGVTVQTDADHLVDWKSMPVEAPGEAVIITKKQTARDRNPE